MLLILIAIIVIAIYIIYKIYYSDNYSEGKRENDWRNEVKNKIEYTLSDNTSYTMEEIPDIEKEERSGIYMIILEDIYGTGNGPFYYVGQAKDLRRRLMDHRRNIINEEEKSIYGKLKDFAFENEIFDYQEYVKIAILEFCEISELTEMELYYMEQYSSFKFGANSTRPTRRPDEIIREEGNLDLIASLKEAEVRRIYLSLEIEVAKLNKGSLSFRKSDTKEVVKFKKNDYAFANAEIDTLSGLTLDDDFDIVTYDEKIDIYRMPKDTLDALIKISNEQDD